MSPDIPDMIRKTWKENPARHLAVPSFVLPAGVAENARFLAKHFPEIALLFFETEACLAYTDQDLPPELAGLPCSWHVHLPLDLPWDLGVQTVGQKIHALVQKVAHFSPRCFVLHPPSGPGQLVPLINLLQKRGISPADILVENIRGVDLTVLWEDICRAGCGVCLDIGHILAYGQQDLLDIPGLWERVAMLHLYGGEHGGRHLPLDQLDDSGRLLLNTLLQKAKNATVTMEVFELQGLVSSVNLLAQWIEQWNGKK